MYYESVWVVEFLLGESLSIYLNHKQYFIAIRVHDAFLMYIKLGYRLHDISHVYIKPLFHVHIDTKTLSYEQIK